MTMTMIHRTLAVGRVTRRRSCRRAARAGPEPDARDQRRAETPKAKTEAAQQKNAEALDAGAEARADAAARRDARRRRRRRRAGRRRPRTGAGYSYDPAGRRDPFVSLTGARRRCADRGRRRGPPGLPGCS